MHRNLVLLTLLSSFIALSSAGSARGDEAVVAGPELQVNTYTTGNQGFPDVAMDSDGDFVVVWESDGPDGDGWGVVARRFGSAGTALGDELQVNSGTVGTQWDPAVAVDGQGNFVVAWQSDDGSASGFDVVARRFDAVGTPLGGEIQVNTYTTGYQGNPSIAATSGGEFLVIWESVGQDQSDGGVYAQLFDAAGQNVGNELRVNDTTAADQNDARVAVIDDGFVIVWESYLQDGSEDSVVLRFLDSTAAPVGGEMIVNTETLGSQEDAAVAVAADGTLAVVWEGDAQDGFGEGIFAQVIDPAGATLGTELQLNTYTTLDQKNPRVTLDGVGGFVAVWTSEGQVDGVSEDLFGQRFDAAGQLVGEEFQVNTQATDDQDVPAIAGGPEERWVVAWRSFGGHDGDVAGVFAQRFERSLFADGFESGDVSAWSAVSP